jgi:hypothetical protein
MRQVNELVRDNDIALNIFKISLRMKKFSMGQIRGMVKNETMLQVFFRLLGRWISEESAKL